MAVCFGGKLEQVYEQLNKLPCSRKNFATDCYEPVAAIASLPTSCQQQCPCRFVITITKASLLLDSDLISDGAWLHICTMYQMYQIN